VRALRSCTEVVQSSEAGAIPALSRNGDAPWRGTSPDACPVPRNQSSEEGRFVGHHHRVPQRAHSSSATDGSRPLLHHPRHADRPNARPAPGRHVVGDAPQSPVTGPRVALLALAVGLLAASCAATAASPPGTPSASAAFPTSIAAANGTVHITSRPRAIVSLSPTATEMLYAIGAGSQVRAVDKDSDYPRQAPHTSLDGFQPNVEAIAAYRPDLVVVASDTGGLTGRLATFGVPVLSLPAATTLRDTYNQLDELGAATGHRAAAVAEVAAIKAQIATIVHHAVVAHAAGSYYYELDPTYFSVTSSTFVGRVLGLLGLRDIADAAPGASASGGYPQLSSEFIVKADPDFVFLADSICCGQSLHTVAARPGWSTVRAVTSGQVVVINDDIASRWGPRIVDLMRTVATALERHGSSP